MQTGARRLDVQPSSRGVSHSLLGVAISGVGHSARCGAPGRRARPGSTPGVGGAARQLRLLIKPLVSARQTGSTAGAAAP
jgi:hypothetical protein